MIVPRVSSSVVRVAILVGLCLSGAAMAEPVVTVEQIPCLLVGENGVVKATVQDNVPDTEVRFFFRRLHDEVEDFYWVDMKSRGNGEYWTVLPKPAEEVLTRHELRELEERIQERSARWWRQKEVLEDRDPNDDLDQELIRERAQVGKLVQRDWMADLSDDELERWLSSLEYEPTEYYAAVYDGFGDRLATSSLQVTQVQSECDTNLTPAEAGLAENLTVGETAAWQAGKDVFHWLCDGVISRIDRFFVWRGDDICRACIVAWWKQESILVPLAAGATTAGVLLIDDDEPPASPFRP